jgi:hypothetical protein
MKQLASLLLAGLCVLAPASTAFAADLARPSLPDPVLDADPFTAEDLLAKDGASANPPLRAYLQGVSKASRLDEAAAQRDLAAAYEDPKAPEAIVWRAQAVAGLAALRAGDYDRAADLLGAVARDHAKLLTTTQRQENAEDFSRSNALRGQPAQTLESSPAGVIPLAFNALGLTTAPLDVGGQTVTAVVDTGAEASVMTVSTARRLGVHVLPGRVIV